MVYTPILKSVLCLLPILADPNAGLKHSRFYFAMLVCTLILAAVVDAATLNTKVSPVQKVITLLDDLKAKVAADLVAEEKLMDEYAARSHTDWGYSACPLCPTSQRDPRGTLRGATRRRT